MSDEPPLGPSSDRPAGSTVLPAERRPPHGAESSVTASGRGNHSLAIEQACRELENLVDGRAQYLTSGGAFVERQLSAGALMRSRNLLEGMRTLVEGQHDLCGLLMRNLTESFVVGVLALYDSDSVQLMRNDHLRVVDLIIDRNDMRDDGLPELPPYGTQRFHLEQAVRRATDLLAKAEGRATEDPAATLYDLAYRVESNWGSHGLGIATPYITSSLPLGVVRRPDSGTLVYGWRNVGLAGLYVTILARHVFRAFSVGPGDLESLGDRLGELVRPPS